MALTTVMMPTNNGPAPFVAVNLGTGQGGNGPYALASVLADSNGAAIGANNPVAIIDGWQVASTATWTSGTTVNTALTATTDGYDTALLTLAVTGTLTGGAVTFEGYDGVNWIPIKAPRSDSYLTDSTAAPVTGFTKAWQVPVAGFPQFRARLSSVLVGAGSLGVTLKVSSAPDTSIVTVGLDPGQPLPAGSNLLGSVTGVGATISNTPTVTAGAYSAGWVVGGIQTLANALPASFNAVLQSLALKFKATAQTGRWAVALFTASPSGTFGDHAAPAIAAADTALLIGIFPLTAAQSNLGTHTIYQSDGLAHQIDGASTSLYAVVIAVDAPVNPASTSEMTLTAGFLW